MCFKDTCSSVNVDEDLQKCKIMLQQHVLASSGHVHGTTAWLYVSACETFLADQRKDVFYAFPIGGREHFHGRGSRNFMFPAL